MLLNMNFKVNTLCYQYQILCFYILKLYFKLKTSIVYLLMIR